MTESRDTSVTGAAPDYAALTDAVKISEQIAAHAAESMADNIERALRALADYDGFTRLQIMAQKLERAASAAEGFRLAQKTAALARQTLRERGE
jgi:hypothetical protein